MVSRRFLITLLLLVPLLVVGCGIPQEDYDAVLAERDAAFTQAETLQSDLAQAKSQAGDLENELTTLQGELEILEASLAAKEGRISSLQSESSKKSSDLDALRTHIAELEAELEALPEPLFKDDFSDPSSGWVIKSEEGDVKDYIDGEYHAFFQREGWTTWFWNRSAGYFTDFAFEMDARVLNELEQTAYGIV
ncbi:hypothetical protein ACFLW5_02195, partial [Chloroflexota bacterium]